ncbi:MAG: hypothetical protein V3S14_08680 [Anaerolineae bacterium]
MRHPPSDIALPQTVERAILHAVTYADVFDYPLTVAEIHRYLVGVSASLAVVCATLESGPLVRWEGYFTLPDREHIVETRLRRAKVAARMCPRAVQYGLAIASLPFVRMVAVTGALAMNNVEPADDIDYLIVAEPDRLWLCRAMVIALVVKPAACRGDVLCPNYLLSERALALREHNLFTAHELVQMVPIVGLAVYRRMRRANTWTARFLPNAHDPPRRVDPAPPARRPIHTLAEVALRTPVGAWLERWEMDRKVHKFSRQSDGQAEVAFSADWCKGHFESNGRLILEALSCRLQEMEGREPR